MECKVVETPHLIVYIEVKACRFDIINGYGYVFYRDWHGLGPFVGKYCIVNDIAFASVDYTPHPSNINDLGTDSNRSVHQFTVIVIEIVFKFNAISVFESYGLIAFLVVVSKDDKPEIAGLHLGFIEHPFVEKQILIAGWGHHEGDGAALGPWNWLAGLVNGLVEFVRAFHNAVYLFTYGKAALKCHDVGLETEFIGGGSLPQMKAPDD